MAKELSFSKRATHDAGLSEGIEHNCELLSPDVIFTNPLQAASRAKLSCMQAQKPTNVNCYSWVITIGHAQLLATHKA
eukprot:2161488-Pleurochrysis_carterae.AAC.3